jgi:acetamidase/formamidase
MKYFTLPVSPATVHWGYFSKKVAPALTLRSGDRATIETLTHHANDDHERMIAGDPGAESVFTGPVSTGPWRGAAPARPKAHSFAARAKASACIC